jgi:hypothetical protein
MDTMSNQSVGGGSHPNTRNVARGRRAWVGPGGESRRRSANLVPPQYPSWRSPMCLRVPCRAGAARVAVGLRNPSATYWIAISRRLSPRARIDRNAIRHCAGARRGAARPATAAPPSARPATRRPTPRAPARKNTAKSSMFARVRRANSSCAARRAAFVVAAFAKPLTLSPPKPLLPHPNRTGSPTHIVTTTAVSSS